jgi:hypothetical protein
VSDKLLAEARKKERRRIIRIIIRNGQDHFHIEAHIGPMGLDFVSGQYRCLFSRCRKYVINSLIHGGLGMITRPIWKCPCIGQISVFAPVFHFRYLRSGLEDYM